MFHGSCSTYPSSLRHHQQGWTVVRFALLTCRTPGDFVGHTRAGSRTVVTRRGSSTVVLSSYFADNVTLYLHRLGVMSTGYQRRFWGVVGYRDSRPRRFWIVHQRLCVQGRQRVDGECQAVVCGTLDM